MGVHYFTFLHAESALFHFISAYRNWFRHHFIGCESGQPLWTSAHLFDKTHYSLTWVIKSTEGIQFRQGLQHCQSWMPVVDYMTQVELWCIISLKCALVEKDRPVSRLHLFAMRIGIWAIGFGVTHLISSSIMPVRHPRIQFDRLHWLWHYCCSFSTWSIGFRQRHFISTWFIEFRKAALGFGMPYFI